MEEEDWCNEVIRMRYMLTEIKIMASKDETLGNAIYRIKLNLKQQDSLEDDHMIIYHIANTIPKIQTLKFLKEWSVDLPALEFVKCFKQRNNNFKWRCLCGAK